MNKHLVSLILFCFFYTMAHGQTDTLPLACIKEVGRYYQTNSLNALLPVPMGDCLRQHAETVANGPFSDEWKIKALFYLANDFSAEGEWYNAEKIYTEALQLMEILGYQDDGLKAEILSSAGINYSSLLEIERGLSYSRQALELFDKAGMKLAEAGEWISLGTSYANEGEVAKAQSCMAKAQLIFNNTEMAGEDSIGFWASRNLLGQLLIIEGQQAMAQGQQAAEIFQKALAVFSQAALALEKHPLGHKTFSPLTTLYLNISTIYLMLQDIPKVGEYADKIKGLTAVLEKERRLPVHFMVFQKINECFTKLPQGDLNTAFGLMVEAQNLCGYKTDSILHHPPVGVDGAMPNPLLFVQTQVHKIQLFEALFAATKDEKYAAAYYGANKVMADWLSLFRNQMATNEVVANINNRFGNPFATVALAASSMYFATKDLKYVEEAFRYSELDKSFTLRQAVSRKEYLQHAPAAERDLWEKDNSMKTEIRSLIEANSNPPRLKELLEAHRTFLERIEKSTSGPERAYYLNRISDYAPSIATIQDSLVEDDHTAVIEYTISRTSLLVFVITKHSYSMLGQVYTPELDEAARNMVRGINNSDRKAFLESSPMLYDSLLAPALKRLPPNINRLIIIPDGVLREVPFAALLAKQPGAKEKWGDMEWLIKQYALSTGYSAAISILSKKVERAYFDPPRFAAFTAEGNAWNGDSTDCRNLIALGELVAAADSIGNIFKEHGWATSMTKDAFAKNFTDKANENTVALLGMHGCTGNEATDPSDYHFVFSNRRDIVGGYDKLKLSDITGLDLANIQMLVAGSCRSAAGQLERGEGLISLSRSLAIAGCGSLIATMQEVRPNQTATILTKFHHYLLTENKTKDVALQQAMLDYLQDTTNLAAPYFWANIICIGSRSPLGH